jgi:3-dehydroquinate synthase
MPEPKHLTERVALGEQSYDVTVGEDVLGKVAEAADALAVANKRCAVLTDSNVGRWYAGQVTEALEAAGFAPTVVTVPAGEASKELSVAGEVCRKLIRAGLDRGSFLVALGGGVIGDLGGFVAAIFYRGIPFVQLPTTIVSQVDSSVGGKTGVNAPEGKNLIGAFHQPRAVIADVATLSTLPEREYREGFAEVIKHAAIRDSSMFPAITRAASDRGGLVELIERNVAIKARIVEEDAHETSGVRALLNFGHTVGHAIESAAGYGELLHGEAIALGIRAALQLSEEVEALDPSATATVCKALDQFALPRHLASQISTAQIMAKLMTDKKFVSGKIRFVLLRALGDALVSEQVTHDSIEKAIGALRA